MLNSTMSLRYKCQKSRETGAKINPASNLRNNHSINYHKSLTWIKRRHLYQISWELNLKSLTTTNNCRLLFRMLSKIHNSQAIEGVTRWLPKRVYRLPSLKVHTHDWFSVEETLIRKEHHYNTNLSPQVETSVAPLWEVPRKSQLVVVSWLRTDSRSWWTSIWISNSIC